MGLLRYMAEPKRMVQIADKGRGIPSLGRKAATAEDVKRQILESAALRVQKRLSTFEQVLWAARNISACMYMPIRLISRLITSLRWCMLERERELVAMCNIRRRAERSNLLKLAGGCTN